MPEAGIEPQAEAKGAGKTLWVSCGGETSATEAVMFLLLVDDVLSVLDVIFELDVMLWVRVSVLSTDFMYVSAASVEDILSSFLLLWTTGTADDEALLVDEVMVLVYLLSDVNSQGAETSAEDSKIVSSGNFPELSR